MLKQITLLVLAALIAGCASLRFKTERRSQFTDINNRRIFVEYGTEEREESLPNGAMLKFNRKVRVTFPDGERVIFYQSLSPKGVRYRSEDKEYIFIEHGVWCQILRGNDVIYQGIYTKNQPMK